MRASSVTWVFVILALGYADAARRRVRSTTAAAVTTIPASYIDNHSAFTEQTEGQCQWTFRVESLQFRKRVCIRTTGLENLWDKFDIQKLDSHLETWSSPPNDTFERHNEVLLGRQYPGLSGIPGDTNELPSPISPPARPVPPPQQPARGCLGLRGQYPSPRSCANYLNCWDDVVVEQTCPTGLLFNEVTSYCDFAYNVNCGNRPPATPKPSLLPGSKVCPDSNGRYRSSTNCSQYYVCIVSRPIMFNCPSALVYNDILNVCDYVNNVDCKGAATPKPPRPSIATYPPTQPPLPSSRPPPTYAPQPPTYAPTYAPPTYQPQPQPPKSPNYQPQPYPPAPASYSSNPWLSKEADPWHQWQSPDLVDNERRNQETLTDDQSSDSQPTDVTETYSWTNPWTVFQVMPPELMNAPCNNGDVHRLNDACTNVVVCRNNRPQIIRCSAGFSFDKPSDSCKPFSIAKC